MLRKCLIVVAAVAGLALAGCGNGPSEPMPPVDDMLIPVTAVDSLGR